MKPVYQELYNSLLGTIPKDRLIVDTLRTIAYGTDAGLYRKTPQIAIVVESETELQWVMGECCRFRLAFTFRGSGTSVSGQAISDSVLIMLGKGWEGVEILENGTLVKTSVGNTGSRINALLAPFGKKLGPDPASIQSATIAGIVANNSSGMTCGVARNSQNTIQGMRMILADGTLLDTMDPESRGQFVKTHPRIVSCLKELADRINQDTLLTEKIKQKYQIKNTTGFSVNALIDHDDPIDMLEHLMVGSEGCLGFISQVQFKTVDNLPRKATAMIAFDDLMTACDALQMLKDCPVDAAELMDRRTIAAVEDLPGVPGFLKTLGKHAATLLVETRAKTRHILEEQTRAIIAALSQINTVLPIIFYDDEKECRRLWEIRQGFDPIICARSKPGTIMISEDIAVPVKDLGPALVDFHDLFHRHGYDDAVIFGHALAGNLHFVLLQDFNTKKEILRYQGFMEDLVKIVVDKYNGSLKAEHGTGRNMAPFVRYEWGEKIYKIMEEIKTLLDPYTLLNPGVIINENPQAHVSDLKRFPLVDPLVDKCIECGFCERFCVSHGLTLSARQRIVILRIIQQLEKSKEDPETLKALNESAQYHLVDTCASDGLCSLACPSGINVGQFVKTLRSKTAGPLKRFTGQVAGHHMNVVTRTGRVSLLTCNFVQKKSGDEPLVNLSKCIGKIRGKSAFKIFSHMPRPQRETIFKKKPSGPESSGSAGIPCNGQAVYFPSCINRTMGGDSKIPKDPGIITVTQRLFRKAGFELVYPRNLESLCCGLAFESKGLKQAAAKLSISLGNALFDSSRGGKLPILCDMSPCLLHMKKTLPESLALFEPVEFILTFLIPHLQINPTEEPIVVHPVCSLKKMGMEDKLMALARLCSSSVRATRTNCCGFAGDKGFTTPELNSHGLKNLKAMIPQEVKQGFSTSRTCEIGLAEETGIPFQSILYLVDQCTSAIKN